MGISAYTSNDLVKPARSLEEGKLVAEFQVLGLLGSLDLMPQDEDDQAILSRGSEFGKIDVLEYYGWLEASGWDEPIAA